MRTLWCGIASTLLLASAGAAAPSHAANTVEAGAINGAAFRIEDMHALTLQFFLRGARRRRRHMALDDLSFRCTNSDDEFRHVLAVCLASFDALSRETFRC